MGINTSLTDQHIPQPFSFFFFHLFLHPFTLLPVTNDECFPMLSIIEVAKKRTVSLKCDAAHQSGNFAGEANFDFVYDVLDLSSALK